MIPIRARDGVPVSPLGQDGGTGTVAVLRILARDRDWWEEDTGTGLPRFRLSDGSVLSYEPGGQLEYATTAHTSLDALDRRLRDVLLLVAEEMEERGIRLLARGVDPRTPLDEARLVLSGERYPRQRAHYDRKGTAGRAMMLQSAALHLNLDLGSEPADAWNAANTLAPILVAVFANGPLRCGVAEAHRSQRSALWRRLDSSRTGLSSASDDPAREYLGFALAAESFLLGDAASPGRPFAEWVDEGATMEDFDRHLTTLFPEVRPRGYLELRSVDALPAQWCIVPAAVAMALVHHPPTRRRLLRDFPAPTLERLEKAGRVGLQDPGFRDEAAAIQALTTEGLAGLGSAVAGPGIVRRVEEFFRTFTARGLDPGTHPGEAVTD